MQQKERLTADPMAEFRPGQTLGFADYMDEGASNIMGTAPLLSASRLWAVGQEI